MINVVFEGPTGAGKTTVISKVLEHYKANGTKINCTIDLDKDAPLYDVINDMFKVNPLIMSDKSFNTVKYETLVQAADYVYNRERLYSENNEINLFDRNYSSIYSYQYELMKDVCSDTEEFMQHILECTKSGEKRIDLMVYFRLDVNKCIARSEERDGRKYTVNEKKVFRAFDKRLTEFIRYNNSDYKLLIIDDKDTLDTATDKIVKKIDEIIEDYRVDEADKWYNLYKIDVEEFPTPDDYIKFKLGYKKKFISKVRKYATSTKKIAELGCGTGLLAGYFQKQGFEVTAVDLCKKILEYAELIAKESNVIAPCANYVQGDILNLPFKDGEFDVAYSNGVFEHFDDKDIITTLTKQMDIAKYVIIGIPSLYFDMHEKMLGNERSLSVKEWTNLFEQAGAEVLEVDSFHYYSVWRRIFEVKKWFKPKAFLLFVVRKKVDTTDTSR